MPLEALEKSRSRHQKASDNCASVDAFMREKQGLSIKSALRVTSLS